MNKNKYEKYCVGCGLCKSELGCKKGNCNGFTYYDTSDVDKNFFENVCPYSGKSLEYYEDEVWGNLNNVYYGWSLDKNIRYKASSGGVITALAIFLLEKKYVDGIIQIQVDESNPIKTKVVCNTTKDGILSCMGSRYCNSSVLEHLSDMIEKDKKYALIGRPCDVLTLRNYQKKYKKYENIIYTIAFFCAGNPSDNANKNLIQAMGLKKIEECAEMNYRGNGWPGFARAKDYNHHEYTMRYAESWGNYLGRDIRLMCKFCVDGCGATADIACGDYWLLDSNKKPLFDEADGRNLIFARTKLGNKILLEAQKSKYIYISKLENTESIKDIQPAQYHKTTTVFDRMIAFKLFGRDVPKYNRNKLKRISKNNTLKNRFKVFLGTIKRIVKKRI